MKCVNMCTLKISYFCIFVVADGDNISGHILLWKSRETGQMFTVKKQC